MSGYDFSLITLNPDSGIEKAEFGLFQARVTGGKGSKRVENMGKKGLKRWTMESKLQSEVDQLMLLEQKLLGYTPNILCPSSSLNRAPV